MRNRFQVLILILTVLTVAKVQMPNRDNFVPEKPMWPRNPKKPSWF
jgi:hypothetical protein